METDYIVAGLEVEANRAASPNTTQMMHTDYSDAFKGSGCFKDMFTL